MMLQGPCDQGLVNSPSLALAESIFDRYYWESILILLLESILLDVSRFSMFHLQFLKVPYLILLFNFYSQSIWRYNKSDQLRCDRRARGRP